MIATAARTTRTRAVRIRRRRPRPRSHICIAGDYRVTLLTLVHLIATRSEPIDHGRRHLPGESTAATPSGSACGPAAARL